ncbi:MAG: hypothetical protein RLZZ392_120 [Pseudomonadota bacterium]
MLLNIKKEMLKNNILQKLQNDKVITPEFSKYATKKQLQQIQEDEATRNYVRKHKDLLPYFMKDASNKKEMFKDFINRQVVLYDQNFERAVLAGTDRTKTEMKEQLRKLGYRGKLQMFNKLQLGELIVGQIQQNIKKPLIKEEAVKKEVKQEAVKQEVKKEVKEEKVKLSKKERNRLRYEKRKKKKQYQKIEEAESTDKDKDINLVLNELTTEEFIDKLFLNLETKQGKLNEKYNVNEISYTIQLKQEQKLILKKGTSQKVINLLFDKLLQLTKQNNNLSDNDMIKFFIESFSIRGNIDTSFMAVSKMNGELISNKIMSVLQSADSIEIDGLKTGFIFIKVPVGSGGDNHIATKLEDYYNKKGYKQIKNDDEYCFAYALYVAIKHLDYEQGKINLETYKSAIRLRYKKPILKMFEQAGVEPKAIDLTDYKKFEEAFNITINIIDYNKNNACIYPVSTEEQKENQVYLHLINSHYNTILNINSFFSIENLDRKQFCNGCKKVVSLNHKCEVKNNLSICHLCHKSHHHIIEETFCDKCNRTFENTDCYNNHIKTVCKTVFVCKLCDTFVVKKNKKEKHICGSSYCNNCKTFEPKEHNCFISKLSKPEDVKNMPIIFYDYEAYVDDNNEHIPNLIVAHKQNDEGITKHVFRTNDNFCDWLFSNDHKGYTCIAHYSKGYDIHHIKKYLYNNKIQIDFSSIDQGNKTMYLKTVKPNIRFIDSISFFMCPLRDLPETFGLIEIKKGYFPLFFNKPENYKYIGPIPDKNMKEKDAEPFDIWYENEKNKIFNFDEEFLSYCDSDVQVLRESWNAFTTLFTNLEISEGEKNKLNPADYITLASYVQAIYRTYFMPEKSINIIKEINQNTSVVEMEYLLHMEKNILNRPLDRQKKIDKYFVDGYDEKTNTVYEFNGCYYHGCKKCYDPNRINKHNSKTMRMLLSETMKKKTFLEAKGFTVRTMWEHDWKIERKNIIEFLHENAELLRNPNIELRKTFFGGRTEVFDVYAKSTKKEKIAYADFTSLYPSIQALADYPIGVGRYIKENFENIEAYFGFIYCKVRPPENLRIPVLPQTSDGKLMFHLKPMIGQWFSEELKLAISMGYIVEEIYQVYHYDKKGTDLFGDYVRFFSKIKMENSVKDKSKINEIYEENLSARFSIKLDKSKMCYNEGLRFIAKICLNSLWGKFGQRTNMTKTLIIKNNPALFYSYIFNNKYEISNILFLNEDTVEIKYKISEDDPIESNNTNVAIASITTGWARIWLYNAMLKVGLNNVIYCDTDSLIYYHSTGKNPIKTDSCLGGLTDELEGSYIDEIISLAPKTYAYKTKDGKTEVKAKGFSLNKIVSNKINFEKMKEMVYNPEQAETIDYPSRIRLDAKTKTLKNLDESKTFQFNYTKRNITTRILTRITTEPKRI